jgi:hypothetical protein
MSKTLFIRCFGWLCSALLMAATLPAHAQYYWTDPVSDETQPTTCSFNLVSGILCEGSYCDNVSLLCQGTSLRKGDKFWVDYISEEHGAAVCSGNSYMTGISCRGTYCDDISIE